MIYDEIRKERAEQDAEWGGPAHDDEHEPDNWIEYILDKVESAHNLVGSGVDGPDARYRRRMVQVAALAVAAVESLDRRTGYVSALDPHEQRAFGAPAFYALFTGEGDGCDYTIGCNLNWERLTSTTLDDAKAEAVSARPLRGEPGIEKITLLEVHGEHDLAAEIAAAIVEDEQREADRARASKLAQIERLKRELGQ